MKGILATATLMVSVFSGVSTAQTAYPATMRLPVTLYDHPTNHNLSILACEQRPFHEFSACKGYLDSVATGMVQDTLDAEGRPVLKENVFFNTQVARWFRPSADTAYPVAVLSDTLVFHYDTTALIDGIYVFEDNEFFPLDSLGLVAAGKELMYETDFGTHNFGFTMHLQTKYVYYALGAEAVKFNFRGDDDTWLFFNGRLMLDIGGVHSQMEREISLKEVAQKLGIAEGDSITLDLFFAERNPTDSHIRITLNAPRGQPKPQLPAPLLEKIIGSATIKIGKQIDETVYLKVNDGAFAPIADSSFTLTTFPTVILAYGVKPNWQTRDTATLTIEAPTVFSRAYNNTLSLSNEFGLDMFYCIDSTAALPYTVPIAITGTENVTYYAVLGDWKSPPQVHASVNPGVSGPQTRFFRYTQGGMEIYRQGAHDRALITTPNGRIVRIVALWRNTAFWDFSDNNGLRLPYGLYLMTLQGGTSNALAKILVR